VHRRMNHLLIGCLSSIATLSLVACGGNTEPVATEANSLDDFFGAGNPAAQQAQFEKQQRKAEETIAACMRAQGFEYTPSVQYSSFTIPPQPKKGEEVAHKRKHGYNFAASMSQGINQAQPTKDPNQERLSKMSEGERNAYQKALYGFDITNLQTEPSDMPDGCQNKAWSGTSDLWKPLQPKLEALERKTDADPKIGKLNAAFVSCMKKAGYAINKENDIYEKLLSPRQQEIFKDSFGSLPETSVATAQLAAPTIPQEKIDELQKYELLVANADADCRPQKDVDEIRNLRAKYEKAFIEENKVLLDQLKAAQS
jgi:hypothetical protein